jgi:hypothetical protein
MRTTVRLEDALLQQAKAEAARRSTTLTALIEHGLRLTLAGRAAPARRRVELPVCHAGGGVLPGVSLDDSARLLDLMDGRR